MWLKYFRVLTFTWLINFAAFFVIGLAIGGDAMNGHAANGHYFLANHGKLTEVSHQTYVYSYAHATFTIVLHIVMVFSAVANIFVKRAARKK